MDTVMLVYLGFRFEWIYGVAAVVTVFHDTLITVGAFSLTNTDVSLTVIAAILTLIGYSNNDTIVVFDRIRENIKLMRREKLSEIVNRSINQTLSRTILTAGLTFLTVLALFLFGGEVLRGFSLALVIGILIGTYSSIAIAAPILVAYQDWRMEKGKRPVGMNLMYRERADIECEDEAARAADLKTADQWVDKAMQAKQARAAKAAAAQGGAITMDQPK